MNGAMARSTSATTWVSPSSASSRAKGSANRYSPSANRLEMMATGTTPTMTVARRRSWRSSARSRLKMRTRPVPTPSSATVSVMLKMAMATSTMPASAVPSTRLSTTSSTKFAVP